MNRSMFLKMIISSVAACAIFIAIDFLMHAVIFASWWKSTESYWHPPLELFKLIPYAYASFMIYCTVLVWLIIKIYSDKPNTLQVVYFGTIAGLLFGFCTVLANYSVFPMPRFAFFVWPLSFTIESTIASIAARWVLIDERTFKRAIWCLLFALLLIIIAVILQNLLYPNYGNDVFQKM